MLKTFIKEKRTWFDLMPGECYAAHSGVVMTTILGSCVSACVYDPVNGIAGMNHFLLSNERYSKTLHFTHTEAGRYGIQAMELLINNILELGGKNNSLRAKAFGGGQTSYAKIDNGGFGCVGAVNVDFIKSFLDNENIPLAASALGGDSGRVIRFNTYDYSVDVRNISKKLRKEIDARDKKHWENKLHSQQSARLDVEFF